jgi:dTDP-4-amino-4,6-dideoxygalactose transaminase
VTARSVQAELRVPFVDLRHENDSVKDVVRRRAEPGIRTGWHCPEPVDLAPAHRHVGFGRGDFPIAERLSDEALSLPLPAGISQERLDSVCRAVRAYFRAP